jgi:hypothetical protein
VTQEAAGSSPVAPANLDPSLHVESIPLSPIAGNIRGPTKMGEPWEILLPYKIAGQFVAGNLHPFCHLEAATTLPMNPAPPVTRILTQQFHSQLDLRAADATGQPAAPGAGTIQGGSMYARAAPPLFEELSR